VCNIVVALKNELLDVKLNSKLKVWRWMKKFRVKHGLAKESEHKTHFRAVKAHLSKFTYTLCELTNIVALNFELRTHSLSRCWVRNVNRIGNFRCWRSWNGYVTWMAVGNGKFWKERARRKYFEEWERKMGFLTLCCYVNAHKKMVRDVEWVCQYHYCLFHCSPLLIGRSFTCWYCW
jgi:hypothetical protein